MNMKLVTDNNANDARPVLVMDRVCKRYDQVAVDNISLRIMAGERLALIGPSGCGKSTTLRLAAGLERPDRGEVHLHGTCMSGPGLLTPPHARKVALVFQDLALWPHMTVAEHIAFVLGGKRRRSNRGKKTEKIREFLALVRLDKANRYPHQLSGGEQQRLAIARALAQEPRLLLMDEPFSNLDPDLRGVLMEEIQKLAGKLGITLIYVTHQWEEALTMADRVAVMAEGRMLSCTSVQTFSRQLMSRKGNPETGHGQRGSNRNIVPLHAGEYK